MSLEIHGVLISLLISIALPSLVAVIVHRKEIDKLNVKINALEKLIKGENKTNLWTSRPLTKEDKEHYGLEGENK